MSAGRPAVTIACGFCGEHVDVPIVTQINTDEQGRQYLDCDPDMSDLWAHTFTHDEETA